MERFVKGPAGAPVTLVVGKTIDKLLASRLQFVPSAGACARPNDGSQLCIPHQEVLDASFWNWAGGPFRSDSCPGRRIGAAPCTVALPEASQSDDQCAAFI